MTDRRSRSTELPGPGYASAVTSFYDAIVSIRETAEALDPFLAQAGDAGALLAAAGVPQEFVDQIDDFLNLDPLERDSIELKVPVAGPADAVKYIRAINSVLSLEQGRTRSEVVYQSLLVAAYGFLENLVSDVWMQWYASDPERLGIEEKRFSLADVLRFDSPEEAVTQAATDRTEREIFGGFDSWSKWFGNNNLASFTDLACDYDSLYEVVLRRHAVVHSNARANRRYVEQLPRSSTSVEVGSNLLVTAGYLGSALDQLMAFGINLAVAVWVKDHPTGSESIGQFILDRGVYVNMREGRWVVVEGVATRTFRLAGSGWSAQALQCNIWLARKHIHGFESIREEVANWDVSALAPVMHLVKCALLEDLDSAFDILPGVMEASELTSLELAEWPILEPLRLDDRYRGSVEGRGVLSVTLQGDETATA